MKFYQKVLLCAILLIGCWIRVQGITGIPDKQFNSNDAYLYALQAQEIVDQGVLPARDMHRWLPDGRENGQLLSLYAYAIAYINKAIGWSFPKLTLYHIQLYLPTICFIIGLSVLCLFLLRVYGFFFTTVVALILATLPGSIERSAVGFGDRDAWCWMVGMLAVISYLWKEQMEPGWRRWVTTVLCGATVFLGGLSWEGFGFFLVVIIATELWKFCTTDTEDNLTEYILWMFMFVPWLYIISPAYRNGYGSSTHVAAIMLFTPITVLVLRGIRYLLLTYIELSRDNARKIVWGLTLLSVVTGIGYVFMHANTFNETVFAFSENQLMQTIGELADPNYSYWRSRYGMTVVLGSIGLIIVCSYFWKWKGVPAAFSLSIFGVTTFFRDQVNGWVGESACNIIFFVSLVLTVISLAIACCREEKLENELISLATLAWFLLWVGLSRGGKRYDFFIGMPLAYGTAWLLCISPVHLIEKLKEMKILYQHIQVNRVATSVGIIVLILTLLWTPFGGHVHKSVHAAARMRTPIPGQNGQIEAYKWIKDTLPQESVVAASWEIGTQLNVLGGVNTIIDPDQLMKRVYLYNRHVLCAQDEREALTFLKTHKVTHLMLIEQDVRSRSGTYSSIGSNENNDRQFRCYRLARVETPIGTPYRIQPKGQDTSLSFIDIARASPETLTVTAQFNNEKEVNVDEKIDVDEKLVETLSEEKIQRTVNNPISQIAVDLEKGGVVLYFDAETKLQRAYYIPPVGWNSLAIKLFFQGDHSKAFVPVYPTDEGNSIDVKVWEIHYPSDIEVNAKYLVTRPELINEK